MILLRCDDKEQRHYEPHSLFNRQRMEDAQYPCCDRECVLDQIQGQDHRRSNKQHKLVLTEKYPQFKETESHPSTQLYKMSNKRKADGMSLCAAKKTKLTRKPATKARARNPAASKSTDADVDEFYKTDFMDDEVLSKDFELDILPNAVIHPLFAREQFVSKDVDYSVLEPSVRLASQILKSGVLDTLYATMLEHGEIEKLEKKKRVDRKILYRYPVADSDPDRRLTRSQTENVTQALADLAGFVKFRSDPKQPSGACTKARRPKRKEDLNGDFFSKGWPSTIRYSNKAYTKLLKATTAGTDLPLLLVTRYEFAIMLIHETCHALLNACEGQSSWEPLFGNATIAEVGYEFEVRLFGGHIDIIFNKPEKLRSNEIHCYKYVNARNRTVGSDLIGLAVLWEWPYQSLVDFYRKHKWYMGVVSEPKAKRGLDLGWRIPLTFFQQLFTHEFWDSEVAERGSVALRPARVLGYCFRPDVGGNKIPVSQTAEDDLYVKPGYARRDNGEIAKDTPVRVDSNASIEDTSNESSIESSDDKASEPSPPTTSPVSEDGTQASKGVKTKSTTLPTALPRPASGAIRSKSVKTKQGSSFQKKAADSPPTTPRPKAFKSKSVLPTPGSSQPTSSPPPRTSRRKSVSRRN